MANRAVKQPNGLYARFSDILDNFTHINLTREELLGIYRDEYGGADAEMKLERADQNPQRFVQEIETIRCIHGDVAAEYALVHTGSERKD